MRILFLLTGLLATTPALAQTSSQVGAWLDGSGGLAAGAPPFYAGIGGRGSTGVWWGNYDDRMALGRSWGVGASVRLEDHPDALRVAPMVELRRQVDLLVVGLRWRAQVGPEWHGSDLGVGARIGGTVKVRPRPWIGPTLDLDLGAAWVQGEVRPSAILSLGVEGTLRLLDNRRRAERRDARETQP